MCDFFDFDWDDWMIIGPLSENLADDEIKQQKRFIDETDSEKDEDENLIP
ncbi:MAG: hypothetical protein KKE62_06340 [Proteobacteria bacterium]|nr:hypothetical protein [Pseudomonadota bacterium]MBU1542448.1 hypothetical protein [Pseudomonadota bacterium]